MILFVIPYLDSTSRGLKYSFAICSLALGSGVKDKRRVFRSGSVKVYREGNRDCGEDSGWLDEERPILSHTGDAGCCCCSSCLVVVGDQIVAPKWSDLGLVLALSHTDAAEIEARFSNSDGWWWYWLWCNCCCCCEENKGSLANECRRYGKVESFVFV